MKIVEKKTVYTKKQTWKVSIANVGDATIAIVECIYIANAKQRVRQYIYSQQELLNHSYMFAAKLPTVVRLIIAQLAKQVLSQP